MRNISCFLIVLFFGICLLPSCDLEEDPIPEIDKTLYNLPVDLEEWLLPFDSVGKSIIYSNGADSLVSVIVERTYNRTEQDFVECRVENRLAECEFKSVNIAFPEGVHPGNFQAYVSIFSIATNDLRVMANRVGFSASVARVNVDSMTIITELPDNYTAVLQPDFDYNGTESPAILTETITLDNAPAGAIIVPNRMILVKGIGIVEWDDFNGNTWMLEN